jgi:hypothetical protein
VRPGMLPDDFDSLHLLTHSFWHIADMATEFGNVRFRVKRTSVQAKMEWPARM